MAELLESKLSNDISNKGAEIGLLDPKGRGTTHGEVGFEAVNALAQCSP